MKNFERKWGLRALATIVATGSIAMGVVKMQDGASAESMPTDTQIVPDYDPLTGDVPTSADTQMDQTDPAELLERKKNEQPDFNREKDRAVMFEDIFKQTRALLGGLSPQTSIEYGFNVQTAQQNDGVYGLEIVRCTHIDSGEDHSVTFTLSDPANNMQFIASLIRTPGYEMRFSQKPITVITDVVGEKSSNRGAVPENDSIPTNASPDTPAPQSYSGNSMENQILCPEINTPDTSLASMTTSTNASTTIPVISQGAGIAENEAPAYLPAPGYGMNSEATDATRLQLFTNTMFDFLNGKKLSPQDNVKFMAPSTTMPSGMINPEYPYYPGLPTTVVEQL